METMGELLNTLSPIYKTRMDSIHLQNTTSNCSVVDSSSMFVLCFSVSLEFLSYNFSNRCCNFIIYLIFDVPSRNMGAQ